MNATTLQAAAARPLRLAYYLGALATHCRALGRFLATDKGEITRIYRELYASEAYRDLLAQSGKKGGIFDAGMLNPLRGPVLYLLCRILKPETMVETGVADGYSSCLILAALQENGKGKLYSIDLPNQPGEEISHPTGWLVPERLRSRWELTIGDAREVLPVLLDRLGNIDIFFHDSLHSYENMVREFTLSWDHLRRGGTLAADDVTENHAFRDFCRAGSLPYLALFKTGLARR